MASPHSSSSGEIKQADALARTLLFVRRVDRLDFYDSKENIPSAHHYLSLFAGGFKSDKLPPDRSFVNLCSLRSHWAVWVCGGFVPDRFPPTLFEFDARFHYSDGRTEPSQNGGK